MRIFVKYFFVILINMMLLAGLVAFCGYHYFSRDLPDVSELKTVKLQRPLEIMSADGELIATFGEYRRIPLKYDEIPEKLKQAIITTEDTRFFDHHGVDPIGILRSLYVAVRSGTASQGGSTITQQLAKNFFLTPERKVTRKIKEIILAMRIEKVLTKQEILELYLNKIYLGSRAYGVGAAAFVYFGKQVDELTLSEIATLAGLPKAPSSYNPINAPQKAIARRNWVLGRMLSQNVISQQEYQQAINETLMARYHEAKIDFSAPYIAEMARQYVYEKYGEKSYTDGYRVYTTINKKLQLLAVDVLQQNLLTIDYRHDYRGPEKELWKKGEQAWEQTAILTELKNYNQVAMLVPAVVIDAAKRQVMMGDNQTVVLTSKSVGWARSKFKNGNVIWIRQKGNDWVLSQIPEMNSAIVSIDSTDGAIKALVGGFSFSTSKFNRAVQSVRQIGSNIKPFIYAAGLNKGLTLASLLNDAPITINVGGRHWSPKNSPNVYSGPIRLRVGLGLSKNSIMVRVMRIIGVDYAADFLNRFGLPKDNISRTEALVLGAASFSPLQLVRGYAVFANGGYLVSPYLIERIEDSGGRIIAKAEPLVACKTCDIPVPDDSEQIEEYPTIALLDKHDEDDIISDEIPEELILAESTKLSVNTELDSTLEKDKNNGQSEIGPHPRYAPHTISSGLAFLMRSALESNIWGVSGGSWRPTGAKARVLNRRDIGGKTGTTNKSKDVWFSGFGAHLATSVWVGYDDYRKNLKGEAGASAALPAWVAFMKTALSDIPVVKDEPPKDVVTTTIDGHKEYFIKGKELIVIPREVGTTIKTNAGQNVELF